MVLLLTYDNHSSYKNMIFIYSYPIKGTCIDRFLSCRFFLSIGSIFLHFLRIPISICFPVSSIYIVYRGEWIHKIWKFLFFSPSYPYRRFCGKCWLEYCWAAEEGSLKLELGGEIKLKRCSFLPPPTSSLLVSSIF